MTVAAVAGSLIGGRLAGRIPQGALRTAFGWFVVVMGVFVLAQQLDTAVWIHPATWAALGAALTAAVAVRLWRASRRQPALAAQRRSAPVEGYEENSVTL